MSVYWPIKDNLNRDLPNVAPLSDQEVVLIVSTWNKERTYGELRIPLKTSTRAKELEQMILNFRNKK